MTAPVRVEGATEAAAAYRAIAADARDMTEPHRAIADAGEQAARARAPVGRTGALSGSIRGDADAKQATLSVGVPYWNVQEYGSRYVRAQRFMAAGSDAMNRRAPDAYSARMAAIVAKRT